MNNKRKHVEENELFKKNKKKTMQREKPTAKINHTRDLSERLLKTFRDGSKYLF